jgi:hypothetical protein
MWFSATESCSLEKDASGKVKRWHDLSSFGWTAERADTPDDAGVDGAPTWGEFVGHRAVKFNGAGMTLVPPPAGDATLAPEGFTIASANVWESFGATGTPYGIRDQLCLGAQNHDQLLEFRTSNDGGNRRFSMQIEDHLEKTSANDPDAAGLLEHTWFILFGQYASAGGTSTPTANLWINENMSQPAVSAPSATLAANDGLGWNGFWDRSELGAFCDDPVHPMDGELGELLVYDTYLDSDYSKHVYAYLSQRW